MISKNYGKTLCIGLLLLFLSVSTVNAAPVILEMQPDLDTGLVTIWGTGGFGDEVEITFGTQVPPLTIAADQSLCDPVLNPPPPPLDHTAPGVGCVVAEMPANVIDGDYLVCLIGGDVQGCLEGGGNEPPTSLTFKYTGADCASSTNTQSAFSCQDNGALPILATVDCEAKNADDFAASGSPVSIGDEITITASKLNPWVNIAIDGENQVMEIHTSCSQDLVVGQTFGALTLTGFVSKDDDGIAQQQVCYDLTVGAKGPQGVQGKIGPSGPAGYPGLGGPGSGIMCFSTDQTLGSNGKYMGLGTQAGDHTSVSVITPAIVSDNPHVVRFSCKAGQQGGQQESGTCELYHDHPDINDPDFLDGELIGSCPLIQGTPNQHSATCMAMFGTDEFALAQKDSLSVRIFTTTSGNFVGGSACVSITSGDPTPAP